MRTSCLRLASSSSSRLNLFSNHTTTTMAFIPSLSLCTNRTTIWCTNSTHSQSSFLCSTSTSRHSTSSYLHMEERRIADHSNRWRRSTPTTCSSSVTPSPVAKTTPSTGNLLDGKATALTIRTEIRDRVSTLVETHGEQQGRPGLAVVIVGERPDSMTYVRSKRKACDEVGIRSHAVELSVDVTQAQLENIVQELNTRSDIDGILVQLPLPKHLDEESILGKISIEKDVDGFHPLNIGRLCMSGRIPPLFIPCTPRACIELLDRYHIPIQGKNIVVIGRSNIVGLPVAMLCMHRNATVTICHSKTQNTQEKVEQADIIIAACGIAHFVKKDWIKPNAVVVDVGINAVEDKTKKKGYRLVGDVDFEGAKDVVSWITPVPGGVGPMTIAMLLQNTVEAAQRRIEQQQQQQQQQDQRQDEA